MQCPSLISPSPGVIPGNEDHSPGPVPTSPAGPPCLRGFFYGSSSDLRGLWGARATGLGASPTCFQTCAGTAWQSASAGKFGQPVARAQVVLQAGFRAAVFRRIAVFPAHPRRQAHQDRLAAAAGLDPEQRAAVPQQVELDVAAAPVELELALAFAIRRVAAALDDRHVRVEETVADRAQVVEVAFEVGVQVVEEQPAHATRFVAVLQEEIFVAPALVRGVAVVAERRAQVARGAVPVQYVLVDRIEGREVEAAAEPPGHRLPVAYGAAIGRAHV